MATVKSKWNQNFYSVFFLNSISGSFSHVSVAPIAFPGLSYRIIHACSDQVVSHYKGYPSSYLLRGKGARPKSSHKNQLGIYPAQELLPLAYYPLVLLLRTISFYTGTFFILPNREDTDKECKKVFVGSKLLPRGVVTPTLSSHLVAELRIEDYSISTFPPNVPSK